MITGMNHAVLYVRDARRQQRLGDLSRLLPRADALLNDARQRLDLAEAGLARGLERMIERKRGRLDAASGRFRPGLLRARFEVARDRIADRAARLAPGLRRGVAKREDGLRASAARLRVAPIRERIARGGHELERLSVRQVAAQATRLARLGDRLEALDRTRRTLGYEATLARGYAVVRKGDAVVTGVAEAQGAVLEVEFRDGRVKVRAEGEDGDQGALF